MIENKKILRLNKKNSFQIKLRLREKMAHRMDRNEIPNATNHQLNEQIEIRRNELEETTAAMQKTEKDVHEHEAEVNKLRANIVHLQELKAQMQQQMQQGHGQ